MNTFVRTTCVCLLLAAAAVSHAATTRSAFTLQMPRHLLVCNALLCCHKFLDVAVACILFSFP
jgi:hypothetical protein